MRLFAERSSGIGNASMYPLSKTDLDHVLDRTRDLWGELRGGRVFLTGGTGFFGGWLLETLLYANDRIGLGAEAIILTRQPAAFRERMPHLAERPNVVLQQGDMVSFAFPTSPLTHVIHAASGYPPTDAQGAAQCLQESLAGVVRVMGLAQACGAAKLLYTSSGAVYGPTVEGRGRIQEDDPVLPFPRHPRWAYAESKRLSELMLGLLGTESGVATKVARGFAFLGPRLPFDAHFAAGNFVRDALRGGPVVMKSSGTAVRSYLYGADLAVWLWTILFRGESGRPYNVGSDEPISIRELAEAVAGEGASDVKVVTPALVADEPADVYVPDISRARNELGLDVAVPLAEAVRRTMAWQRSAPPGGAVRRT